MLPSHTNSVADVSSSLARAAPIASAAATPRAARDAADHRRDGQPERESPEPHLEVATEEDGRGAEVLVVVSSLDVDVLHVDTADGEHRVVGSLAPTWPIALDPSGDGLW